MRKRPRDHSHYLKAFWAWKFPHRPPKTEFSDEVLCAVEFIMFQLDPAGTKAVIVPPMPAHEGYEHQPSVRAKGDVEMEA